MLPSIGRRKKAGRLERNRLDSGVSLDPETKLVKVYIGCLGFKIVGKSIIRKSMAANGNEDLPFHGRTNWAEEMMNDRGGVAMERVVKRSDIDPPTG
jgi:hypothetical protein